MARTRKLTPELIEAAKRLRAAGKTQAAIATDLGVSHGTIANALREEPPPSGTPAPPPPSAPTAPPPSTPDPDRDELKELDSIIATVGDRLRAAADVNDVTRTGSLGRLYASLIGARRKIAPQDDGDGVWLSSAEIDGAKDTLLSKLDRVAQVARETEQT